MGACRRALEGQALVVGGLEGRFGIASYRETLVVALVSQELHRHQVT